MTQPWTEEELAQWERAAARMLRGLGLCPVLRGDRRLCLLLALAAAWPEQLALGLEPLYREAARRRGGTLQSQQRALRRSLLRLWRRGDRLLLGRWFARLKGGGCPGNQAFLLVLSGKLREQNPLL